jgi:hypothetical protein
MIWWPTTLLVDTVRDTLPGSVLAPQIQVEYLLAQLEGAIKLRMQEIDGRGGNKWHLVLTTFQKWEQTGSGMHRYVFLDTVSRP